MLPASIAIPARSRSSSTHLYSRLHLLQPSARHTATLGRNWSTSIFLIYLVEDRLRRQYTSYRSHGPYYDLVIAFRTSLPSPSTFHPPRQENSRTIHSVLHLYARVGQLSVLVRELSIVSGICYSSSTGIISLPKLIIAHELFSLRRRQYQQLVAHRM